MPDGANLDRRAFLSLAAGGAAAATSAGLGRAADEPRQERPNIVLIMVDDLGREWLSCYGSEEHQTPNLDALAEDGVRFETCYATPLCTPTRTELLTGRYSFRVGWTLYGDPPTGGPEERLAEPGWINHWDVPRWAGKYFDWEKEITFARVLRQAGYATAIAGKWQINDFRKHPDALHQHGFDEHCMWTGYETGNPPSGERYWAPYIQQNGNRRTRDGGFGPDIFCDFLIDFMRRNRDRPFLAYYPMVLTHGPFTTTPHNRESLGADTQGAQRKRQLFPGMVDYVDHLVGQLVGALDELRVRDNTLVFFTTDNGSPGVSCRANGLTVPGGKGKITEAGICVPLIANCPRLIPGGRVTDALVDFSDILPTFAELGDAPLPEDVRLDGRSFASVLAGESEGARRDWIYSQLGERRVVRDERFKLHQDGKLYDLAEDPLEQADIAGSDDAAAKAAKERLAAALRDLGP
jgi:arylsulfatase A-like enzyme